MTTDPNIVFKAMGDRTRQRTLAVLSARELSVGELVDVLAQPQSTVSRHLKILRNAGLIQDRRNGTTVLYSVVTQSDEVNGSDLADQMLAWVSRQKLTGLLRSRLDAVVQRRREVSDRFFETIGSDWDSLREEYFGAQFHLEAFLDLLPHSWTVADVGTGTGYLLLPLASQFERVIGVEPVEGMLEAARNRIRQAGLKNVELRRGELSRLPLEPNSINLAVAVLVMHHVPVPEDALSGLYRILRDRGSVLIVEQTAHDNEALRARMQDRWWGFDPSEFASLLRHAGFRHVRWRALAAQKRSDDTPNLFVVSGRKSGAGADDQD